LVRSDQLERVFDFSAGAVGYRFRSGAAYHHPLVKATGLSLGNLPTVVDATAGLGRDAFLLASLGARVIMLERSPEIHTLLQMGLAKASAHEPAFAAVVARMTLMLGDARDILPSQQSDVVIVDPMHPPRKGTALVKKEMRLIREIVGTDSDALELMCVALSSHCGRVVLKWPLRADPLQGLPRPTYQIAGKTVRYDVFLRPSVRKEVPGVASSR
jgi:16S rRNA (guanine1516-N2)-methyltransferase